MTSSICSDACWEYSNSQSDARVEQSKRRSGRSGVVGTGSVRTAVHLGQEMARS